MPNPNHDPKSGQFSSGNDSGQHGTGVTHSGNAGISASHGEMRRQAADTLAKAAVEHAKANAADVNAGHRDIGKAQAEAQARSNLEKARAQSTAAGVKAIDLQLANERLKNADNPNSKHSPGGGWRGPVRN